MLSPTVMLSAQLQNVWFYFQVCLFSTYTDKIIHVKSTLDVGQN